MFDTIEGFTIKSKLLIQDLIPVLLASYCIHSCLDVRLNSLVSVYLKERKDARTMLSGMNPGAWSVSERVKRVS